MNSYDYLIIDPDSSYSRTVCCIPTAVFNSVCSTPSAIYFVYAHDAQPAFLLHKVYDIFNFQSWRDRNGRASLARSFGGPMIREASRVNGSHPIAE